jgi:hypothetical protein
MRFAVAVLALFVATGCNEKPKQAPAPLSAALADHVLDDVPSDLENRTFIDFGGKVHVVGVRIEPKGIVRPGEKVKLRLYWRSVEPLTPGWSLFTHLVNARGQRLENVDNVGPLRERGAAGEQALAPSSWQPGKVYVDEQEFEMPRGISDSVVTIVVGVWKGNARLSVISGSADRENRAIIAHIKTGVRPPKPVAKNGPEQK